MGHSLAMFIYMLKTRVLKLHLKKEFNCFPELLLQLFLAQDNHLREHSQDHVKRSCLRKNLKNLIYPQLFYLLLH